MKNATEPEVSLIVPVLNEENNLQAFQESLATQKDIVFEVVFSDGGSEDDSTKILCSRKTPLKRKIITAERGRARQMNRGAAHATARNLLFIHADSIFRDPLTLRWAVDALESRIKQDASEQIAGHFSLRFSRTENKPSLAYFFYECKTSLNRAGCINGDQGLLLRRSFFQELGGFDESLPFLEDERMARTVSARGKWILLPGEILTSARRFETEGFFERQVLNALIMNFSTIGWNVFFQEAAGIYRLQKDNGRLNLLPFFNKIISLLRRETWKKRLSLWYLTGTYVNQNAWQLPFVLDVRRSFRCGSVQRNLAAPCLQSFDSHWKVFIEHPPGYVMTAALSWLWFYGYRAWMHLKSFFRN